MPRQTKISRSQIPNIDISVVSSPSLNLSAARYQEDVYNSYISLSGAVVIKTNGGLAADLENGGLIIDRAYIEPKYFLVDNASTRTRPTFWSFASQRPTRGTVVTQTDNLASYIFVGNPDSFSSVASSESWVSIERLSQRNRASSSAIVQNHTLNNSITLYDLSLAGIQNYYENNTSNNITKLSITPQITSTNSIITYEPQNNNTFTLRIDGSITGIDRASGGSNLLIQAGNGITGALTSSAKGGDLILNLAKGNGADLDGSLSIRNSTGNEISNYSNNFIKNNINLSFGRTSDLTLLDPNSSLTTDIDPSVSSQILTFKQNILSNQTLRILPRGVDGSLLVLRFDIPNVELSQNYKLRVMGSNIEGGSAEILPLLELKYYNRRTARFFFDGTRWLLDSISDTARQEIIENELQVNSTQANQLNFTGFDLFNSPDRHNSFPLFYIKKFTTDLLTTKNQPAIILNLDQYNLIGTGNSWEKLIKFNGLTISQNDIFGYKFKSIYI